MNKKDYLHNLLALCTDKQKKVFTRMYPDGPKNNQVSHAIRQVENTLKNLNATNENLKTAKEEGAENAAKLQADIRSLEIKLHTSELQRKAADNLANRLKNPIATENNSVQERLNLLDALVAGGVDNWEWYEEAINNYQLS